MSCVKCNKKHCLVASIFTKTSDFHTHTTCQNITAGTMLSFDILEPSYPLIILEDGVGVLYKNQTILSLNKKFFFHTSKNYQLYALTDMRICSISKDFYFHYLKQQVKFKYLLSSALSRHLDQLENRLLLFNQLSLSEQILHTLASLFSELGNEIPLSVKFLAEYCFTSKEEVSRQLKELREQNIIKINRKSIILLKKKDFQHYLSLHPSLRNINKENNFNHIISYFNDVFL
jgi:DNA-binding transcriptional ArsR family regulator